MVEGIQEKPEEDLNRARFHRQLHETCAEPFVDPKGITYIFRTILARPAAAPNSIDEIEPQIIEDIRCQKGFDEAKIVADKLAETAEKEGLEVAFNKNAALKEKLEEEALVKPDPFTLKSIYGTRVSPTYMIPQIGYDPQLVETCFELTKQDEKTRVTVYEQNSRQRWLVIQWLETLPITETEFNEQRNMAIGLLSMERQMEVLRSWFDPEQIKARAQWTDAPEFIGRPEGTEDEDEKEEESREEA
jgi:hypothetical protein